MRQVLRGFGLRGADLEDACQEVFLIAHRRWSSFEGRSTVQSWLYSICRYVVYGQQRRAYRRYEVIPEKGWERALDESEGGVGGATWAEIDRQRRQHALHQALDSLKDSHRDPLLMYELGQVSLEDVATFLHTAPRTVRARIHAARHELKRRFRRATQRRIDDARRVVPAPSPLDDFTGRPPSVTAIPDHISYCDDSFSIASIGHVVIVCSRGRPTAAQPRAIGRHVATVASQAPGKAVVIDCVDAVPAMPGSDWRREAGKLALQVGADVAAYALVMREAPLRRIVFGFIVAIILWAGRDVPAAAFPSAADATRWFRQRDVLGSVREEDIEAVVEALRKRMDAHFSASLHRASDAGSPASAHDRLRR